MNKKRLFRCFSKLLLYLVPLLLMSSFVNAYYDFGGFYAIDTSDSSCATGNTLADGACGCLDASYTPYLGGIGSSGTYEIYYCVREHVEGQDPDYELGGIFFEDMAGTSCWTEPTSGLDPSPTSCTCPAEYPNKAYASGGMSDTTAGQLAYCYRNYDSIEPYHLLFGGMFIAGASYSETVIVDDQYCISENSLTGDCTCPGDNPGMAAVMPSGILSDGSPGANTWATPNIICTLLGADEDGDEHYNGIDDCDDSDPNIHSGATELEDGIDNDCDGQADEDFVTVDDAYIYDADGTSLGKISGECDSEDQCAPCFFCVPRRGLNQCVYGCSYNKGCTVNAQHPRGYCKDVSGSRTPLNVSEGTKTQMVSMRLEIYNALGGDQRWISRPTSYCEGGECNLVIGGTDSSFSPYSCPPQTEYALSRYNTTTGPKSYPCDPLDPAPWWLYGIEGSTPGTVDYAQDKEGWYLGRIQMVSSDDGNSSEFLYYYVNFDEDQDYCKAAGYFWDPNAPGSEDKCPMSVPGICESSSDCDIPSASICTDWTHCEKMCYTDETCIGDDPGENLDDPDIHSLVCEAYDPNPGEVGDCEWDDEFNCCCNNGNELALNDNQALCYYRNSSVYSQNPDVWDWFIAEDETGDVAKTGTSTYLSDGTEILPCLSGTSGENNGLVLVSAGMSDAELHDYYCLDGTLAECYGGEDYYSTILEAVKTTGETFGTGDEQRVCTSDTRWVGEAASLYDYCDSSGCICKLNCGSRSVHGDCGWAGSKCCDQGESFHGDPSNNWACWDGKLVGNGNLAEEDDSILGLKEDRMKLYGCGAPATDLNYGALPGDLVAYWQFENDLADSKGRAHGTTSTPTFTAGKAGQSFDFDGTKAVIPPDDGMGLLNDHTAHTISAWINRNSDSSMQAIFIEGSDTEGYGLYLNDGADQLTHFIRSAAGTDDRIDYAVSNLAVGQWHHVAGVWNGASGELSIYVDGVQAATKTTSISSIPDPIRDWRIGGSDGISGEPISGSLTYNLNGKLDELMIFSRALPLDEITYLADTGISMGSATNCEVKSDYFCQITTGGAPYKWVDLVDINLTDSPILDPSTIQNLTQASTPPDESQNTFEGCCPEDHCFTGAFQCVSLSGTTNAYDIYGVEHTAGDGYDGELYRCTPDGWEGAIFKYSPDRSKEGFCALQSQCFYSAAEGCLNDTQYIEDHYCENGEWTTRTKILALTLLDLAATADYTLFCGDIGDIGFGTVINDAYPEYTPAGNYAHKMCVIEYGNNKIFGSVLMDGQQDNYLWFVLKKPYEYCTGVSGEGYDLCDEGYEGFTDPDAGKVWLDNSTNILIYSKAPLSPGMLDPKQTVLGQFGVLLGRITGLVDWIVLNVPEPPDPYGTIPDTIPALAHTRKFNRLFMAKQGTKEIYAILEEKPDKYTAPYYEAIEYSGFNTDMCAYIDEYDDRYCPIPRDTCGDTLEECRNKNEITKCFYCAHDAATSTYKVFAGYEAYIDPLSMAEPAWIDLTSKIRIE